MMKQLPFVFLLACLALLSPEIALAQGGASCTNIDPESGILTPIVTCVTQVIDAVSSNYFDQLASMLQGAVMVAFTLAIAIHSFKVLTGAISQPYGEAALLLLKIVLVSYFVLNAGATQYIDIAKDVSAGLTDIMTELLFQTQTNTVFTGTKLLLEQEGSATAESITLPGGANIWLLADQVLNQILGLGNDQTGLEEGAAALALILISTLSAGPVGTWLLTISSFVLFFLLSVFTMAIFTYMISFIAIGIIGALGPIFIPMILFNQTKTLFEKWLQQLLSYALQPVILTAYLIFMLTVMIAASVDFVARYHTMEERLEDPSYKNEIGINLGGGQHVKDKDFDGVTTRKSFDLGVVMFVDGVLQMEPSESEVEGVTDYTAMVPFTNLSADETTEMFIDFLVLLFMALITMSFIQQLPDLVTDIIGDRTVPNLAANYGAGVQRTVMSAQGVITGAAKGVK